MSFSNINYTSATTASTGWITLTDGIGSGNSIVFTGQSPSGTSQKLEISKSDGKINPRLYFKFVKSKFNYHQERRLRERLIKLKQMVEQADELGQQALYEQLSIMLAVVVRESEAFAVGITKWIERKHIDKFINRAEHVYFKLLDDFPRLVPPEIQKRVRSLQDKKIFDQYHVLYIDYVNDKQIKTNKEKIKEKDPIIFGSYAYQPDKFYYIADWIDEHCDLTLDKFIEKVRIGGANKIPKMDDDLFKDILDEVKARHDRLSDTNSSNWKENIKKEEADRRAKRKAGGSSWRWKFWKSRRGQS